MQRIEQVIKHHPPPCCPARASTMYVTKGANACRWCTPLWATSFLPPLRQGSLSHFAVVKVPARLAQNLIVFVPLASDNDGVLGLGHGNSVFNGLLAVGNGDVVHCSVYTRDNGVNNALRLLSARIVRRDNGVITQSGRYLPHQRTLARVAVTTTTKHGNQTPGGFCPHEL